MLSVRALLLLIFVATHEAKADSQHLANLKAIVASVSRREEELKARLGPYKFYVYEGGAFDAISTDLLAKMPHPGIFDKVAEYRANVWIHRALLVDPSRTLNPKEADLFFVPGYLQISHTENRIKHSKRLTALATALRQSPWYQRNLGADHLFACGDVNPGWSKDAGLESVRQVLSRGFIGSFEMNPSWVGGDWPLERVISIPYVAAEAIADGVVVSAAAAAAAATGGDGGGDGASTDTNRNNNANNKEDSIVKQALKPRQISLYFAASDRPHAVQWGNCSRLELNKLASFPKAIVHVHALRRRRRHIRRRRQLFEAKEEKSYDDEDNDYDDDDYDDYDRVNAPTTVATGNAHRNSSSSSVPMTIHQRSNNIRRRALRHSQSSFAKNMEGSNLCPLMCGDTPTSRRTFDAYLSGCLPLFVGTRLWGRCDPPCVPGWGWSVSGAQFPHLPFHGLWIDWSRFPILSEKMLASAQTSDKAQAVLKESLRPLAARAAAAATAAAAAGAAAGGGGGGGGGGASDNGVGFGEQPRGTAARTAAATEIKWGLADSSGDSSGGGGSRSSGGGSGGGRKSQSSGKGGNGGGENNGERLPLMGVDHFVNQALEQSRAYLFATRLNLLYGSGDCHTSTDFGLAPRRLVEATLFRLRRIDDAVSPPLPDPLRAAAAAMAAVGSDTSTSSSTSSGTSGSTSSGTSGSSSSRDDSNGNDGGGFGPLPSTVAEISAPYSPSILGMFQTREKLAKRRAKHRGEEVGGRRLA